MEVEENSVSQEGKINAPKIPVHHLINFKSSLVLYRSGEPGWLGHVAPRGAWS